MRFKTLDPSNSRLPPLPPPPQMERSLLGKLEKDACIEKAQHFHCNDLKLVSAREAVAMCTENA